MKRKATGHLESFDVGGTLVAITVALVLFDALLFVAWVLR